MLKHSNGTKDGLVSNKPFNISNDTHLLMKEAGLSTQRGARELRSELHGLPHIGGDSRYGGKPRCQATAQAERQIHATNVCTRTLATHVHSSRARCSIYGKASTREDKSSKWLHPASPPIKTIIWCCFAAGVDAVMLRSEEKANKRRRTVWS